MSENSKEMQSLYITHSLYFISCIAFCVVTEHQLLYSLVHLQLYEGKLRKDCTWLRALNFAPAVGRSGTTAGGTCFANTHEIRCKYAHLEMVSRCWRIPVLYALELYADSL
jgi:hypothetical protein